MILNKHSRIHDDDENNDHKAKTWSHKIPQIYVSSIIQI